MKFPFEKICFEIFLKGFILSIIYNDFSSFDSLILHRILNAKQYFLPETLHCNFFILMLWMNCIALSLFSIQNVDK